MKKILKAFSILILTTVLISILTSVFGGYAGEEINVQNNLNLNKLKSRGDTIRILEIVPHKAKTTLSYMIKGYEPVKARDIVGTQLIDLEDIYGYYSDGTYVPSSTDVIDATHNAMYYERLYYMTDVFKRSLFGATAKIELTVATPSMLNADLSLISTADLIYISDTGYEKAEYLYVNKVLGITDSNLADQEVEKIKNTTFKSDNNDLTWNTVKKLYEYVAINEYPIILSSSIYDGNNTTNNVDKLIIMLCQVRDFKDVLASYINWNTGEYKHAGVFTNEWDHKWTIDDTNHSINSYFIPPGGDVTTYLNAVINKNIMLFNGNDVITDGNNTRITGNAFNKLVNEEYRAYDGIVEDSQDGKDICDVPEDMKYIDVVKYIIGHGKIKEVIKSTDTISTIKPFKILEVEPCKSFKVKSIIEAAGYSVNRPDSKFHVVEMTSHSFNTIHEDLVSDYDLIIMGLTTGNMNVYSGSGKTQYNDISLDGKIYLHIGDLVRATVHIYPKQEEVNGNTYKVDSAGYTRYNGNDITNLKRAQLDNFIEKGLRIIVDENMFLNNNVNSQLIDNSSVIFKFLNENISKANLKKYNYNNLFSEITKAMFSESPKPKLEMLESPIEYVDFNSQVPSRVVNEDIISTLKYKFRVGDQTDETYSYKLILDVDGDGRFDDTKKDSKDINIGAVVVESSSSPIKPGSLCNISYDVQRNYTGLITWKIEVTSSNGLTSYKVGHCAIMGKKQKVRVLQIIPDATQLNFETNLNSLITGIPGFDFDVKVVSISTFNGWYVGKPYKRDNINSDQLMKNYDMIILGFWDSFNGKDIANTNGELDNLEEYIESQRIVLFSHDTTGFYVKSGSFAKNITDRFRNILGMDRFGLHKVWKAGESPNDSVRESDKNYITSTRSGKISTAIEAITDTFLLRYPAYGANESKQLAPFLGQINRGDTSNTSYDYNENIVTTKAAKVNEGVISIYPYKISFDLDNFLGIASTHAQYFALDMEDDDITVWYTLAGDKTKVVRDTYKGEIYDQTQYDGRSNYYIYTKGSITYSGAGHSELTGSSNIEERKLFVNTTIAALANANHAPYIELSNVNESATGKIKYISEVDTMFDFNMRIADIDFKDVLFEKVIVYVDKDMDKVYNESVDYLISIYDGKTKYNDVIKAKIVNNVWNTQVVENIQNSWFNSDNKFNIVIEVTDARSESIKEKEVLTVVQRKLFNLK